jgi:hypothetical protein
MNAIAVTPKTIELVPARTAEVSSITWRATDDAFARRLTVVVNNATSFQISGADYDALGQWTDETIRDLIVARFGLQLAA